MIYLEASVFITILVGFLATIIKKNLLMKIVTMDVMSTGVVALFVVIATHSGLVTPILRPGAAPTIAYADPVPQGVILTAIVIGLSIQTLMLVAAMKLARDNPTLETSEIDQKYL
jgi:multicomponent Na+:H+ antiporter subunit C